MIGNRNSGPATQRGMALVIVLWIVALLGVIATGHIRNAHTATVLAARQVELAQFRASANAGLQLAIIDLLAQGNPNPWPVNGSAQLIEIRDHEVSVAIRDAAGLLDLNNASQRLLLAVLESAVPEQVARDALADAILDWRDKDSLVRLNGAEAAAYPANQLGWTIRNGPFATVDELRYVSGMTNEVFAQIAPLVTVYSGRSGIDIEYAPGRLVQALIGQEFVAPRQPRLGARAGTFHITISATSAAAVSIATLEAVVRIAPSAEKPFSILHWQEPVRALPNAGG